VNWDWLKKIDLKHEVFGMTVLDLLISAGILFGALIAIMFIKRMIRRSMKEKMSKDQLQLTSKVVNYSVLGLAAFWIFAVLDQNLSGLVVAGGVVGVVLGFASQSVVSNLISGIFIMIERPIRIGHSVNIKGTVGIVEEIRIMSTIVRTFDGLYVRIPNIDVFTTTLINYVANVARRTDFIIGIRHSDDADKAISLIKEIFADETLVLVNPEPNVFVDNYSENAANLFVRFWAPADEWWDLKMKLLLKIKKKLAENGIQIALAQREIWVNQRNGAEKPEPPPEAPAETETEPTTESVP